jgi:hypothetical protein
MASNAAGVHGGQYLNKDDLHQHAHITPVANTVKKRLCCAGVPPHVKVFSSD